MENIRTIKSLSNKQICFVKRLYLENSFFGGVVCYTRSLSDTYKMNIKKRSKEELYLYQYEEDEYPKDELDIAILNALKIEYQNIVCKTSLQFFDAELEENLRWKDQREVITSRIQIEEMVKAVNTPFATPLTCPRRTSFLTIEIYFLKGLKFDRAKAGSVRLYPCNTAEYEKLERLRNNTYSVYSNNK